MAQDISYETVLGLGYNSIDMDGADADGFVIGAQTELTTGRFGLDVDLGHASYESDGVDLSNGSVNAAAHYRFYNNVGAGLYVARDSLDADLGDKINIDSYGAELVVRDRVIDARLFFGETELDEAAGLVDVNDFGLHAAYKPNEALTLYGKGVWSSFEVGGFEGDASSVGIGANYVFANGLSLFGGYQSVDVEDADFDLRTISVGAGYTFATGSTPITVSAEYAQMDGQIDGFGGDAEQFNISATMAFGNAASTTAPITAVTGTLTRPDRNALAGLLSSGGL